MSSAALDIIDNYFTCEFTTLSRDGSPQTWPVTPRLLTDGRLLLTTSIGLPQKAFNIRRNPQGESSVLGTDRKWNHRAGSRAHPG